LARTGTLLRADLDHLDELAAAAAVHSADAEVDALRALPAAVRGRVLRRWAEARGAASLSAGHVATLEALVTRWRGQGPVDLPGGVRVRRLSGRLTLDPAPPSGPSVRE
jgi:tRNA(Ile)-lysidine synthase